MGPEQICVVGLLTEIAVVTSKAHWCQPLACQPHSVCDKLDESRNLVAPYSVFTKVMVMMMRDAWTVIVKLDWKCVLGRLTKIMVVMSRACQCSVTVVSEGLSFKQI